MRHPVTREVVTFPCGKCIECIQKYQNDWTFRLENEFSQWRKAYFLTLTLRDDSIPYVVLDDVDQSQIDYVVNRLEEMPVNEHLSRRRRNLSVFSAYLHPDNVVDGIPVPCVSKSYIQDWLKRGRENYFNDHGERLPLKYFICSEYGPSTFRPHYHAILFCNLSVSDLNKYFIYDWQLNYGRVCWKFRPIKYDIGHNGVGDVMAYVAKYCCKPDFVENPYVVAGIIPRPFRLMSKGLGLCYYNKLCSIIDSFKFPRFIDRTSVDYSFGNHVLLSGAHGYVLRKYSSTRRYLTHRFCEFLSECFTTLRNGFRYRIPRYYIDRWFPQKKYVCYVYDSKKQCFKESFQMRKDSSDPVWLTFKAYMVNQCTKRLHERVLEVASSLFGSVDLEALNSAEAWIRQDDICLYKAKAKKLCDFYAKGLAVEL